MGGPQGECVWGIIQQPMVCKVHPGAYIQRWCDDRERISSKILFQTRELRNLETDDVDIFLRVLSSKSSLVGARLRQRLFVPLFKCLFLSFIRRECRYATFRANLLTSSCVKVQSAWWLFWGHSYYAKELCLEEERAHVQLNTYSTIPVPFIRAWHFHLGFNPFTPKIQRTFTLSQLMWF